MRKNSLGAAMYITRGALIAAIYVALTYLSSLMGLSSGAETKAYFEDPKFTNKLFDWGQCCNNGSFAGNFDGNGVEIYGLYVNPVVSGSDYARQNVGLFGCVDPGVLGAAQTGSGGVKTYNDNGNKHNSTR